MMATVKNYLCPWLKPGYPVKLRKVHIDPPLKPFKDPLCGCTTQLSVVDKLAEGVINPTTSQIWWIAA